MVVDILGSIAKLIGDLVMILVVFFLIGYVFFDSDSDPASAPSPKTEPASVKEVPKKLDPKDEAVKTVRLSAPGKEILENANKLEELGLKGFKMGNLLIGSTTKDEAIALYPDIGPDLGTCLTENIGFPLPGDVTFRFDSTSGIITHMTIESDSLDIWEELGMRKMLPLQQFECTEKADDDPILGYSMEICKPIGLKNDHNTPMVPSIEIYRSPIHNSLSVSVDWPALTFEQWQELNNRYKPIQEKPVVNDALKVKANSYFN